MAENKTRRTDASVPDFLDSVPDPQRREDARKLCTTMGRLTGEPPYMYGPTIVGFGRCRYKYDSGREGDMPRLAFSPRAKELVLYVVDDFPRYRHLMDRLGRHRTGKSCLYVKRLADVDESVLEALMIEALEDMKARYPEGA